MVMIMFQEIPASKRSISLRRPLFKIGINDSVYKTEFVLDSIRYVCPYYRVWRNMLGRCYDKKTQLTQPAYIGCVVTKEWHLFSKFKSWMMSKDWKGKALDKDLLIPGNKIYSPETCIFVTQEINSLLLDHKAKRGIYKQGVIWCTHYKKYLARCNINGKSKHLGYFLSEEEASNAYIKFKKEVILTTASLQTDIKLKHALIQIALNYQEKLNEN